ncbi:MAG: hypothetical protein ABS35_14495 [Kaistia sp. SCN 65-12]|uniref:acetate--CoA ligase family protein n=1 Tax=Hyphomicrobium sp. CS1BSMeth3 TaxID=1892844 RepID=UPI00086A0958|nr:acetate--CoA ligase family protein [Hyphomicrobium sp. CS1BSMeth3]ODT22629.1 MAG: hypothetical protein ABS35_14495 [Kaistia sp. SCN 65-12]
MTTDTSPLKRELFGRRELARVISPNSIAVVGASETPGSFGLRTLENIRIGYQGKVFPVNPRRNSILDMPCFGSLEALPEVPDCVILAVPKEAVEAEVTTCAKLGVGGVIVYASGFAETGSATSRAAQDRLSGIARETGLRIIGPNTVGIANLVSHVGLHFMPKFSDMPIHQGKIGLVSQSGGLGYTIIQAMQRGIGFSYFLSAGNSCDVDICDLINYLVEDDATHVIACMFEGVRDGDRLVEAGRRALAAGKPLIVYKMGRSEISRRTALSHTGSLTGADAVYRAAFRKIGAIVLDNWEDVLETAGFFARADAPRASGVGVMASSGGAAVMAADKAEEFGVELPPPTDPTKQTLAKYVPDFGSISNPTDMTAETLKSFDLYGSCIRAFAQDPGYGAVVVPMLSAQKPITVDRAKYLSDLAADLDKPICLVWINEWLEGPGSEIYDSSQHIAMFRSMGRCMQTLALWNSYHAQRADLLRSSERRRTSTAAAVRAKALLRSVTTGVLSEHQSKSVLAAYGLPIAAEELAPNAEAAVQAAIRIGFPVVVKADSPDIPHKTEAGVVHLNISDEVGVSAACTDILGKIAAMHKDVRLNGLLVQRMVRGGTEMIIGARNDPQFGPLVTCGLGGVGVEVFRDVVTALAPVDRHLARSMVSSLKCIQLLTGYRNQPALAVDEFADLVCCLSELIADLRDEIEQIDVNPVMLSTSGCLIVDSLIIKAGTTGD